MKAAIKAQDESKVSSRRETKRESTVSSHSSVDNYKGDVASRVTKLFNVGQGVREAVVECEITYELAKHLHEEWKTAGPELHLTPKLVAQLQARFDWWDKPTPEGFMAALNRYIQREIERTSEEVARSLQAPAPSTVSSSSSVGPAPKASVAAGKSSTAPASSEDGGEISDAEREVLEAEFRRIAKEDQE